MAKKVTISILSVLVIAGIVFGIYFFTKDVVDDTATPQQVQTEAEEEFDGYMDEDVEEPEYIIDDTEETEVSDKSDDYVPSDDDLADNTNDIVTTDFSISKIVDHTTSQEVHPRVVFGSGYNPEVNYIKFDTDGNFEMFLSGYFNNTTKGKFTDYGNIIYVEYSDGTAAEYDVKHTDSKIISHIIVNYGDYDIYFS
ncbi:MAG: hypothetical protein IJD68_05715 [Ruminococcus sp.]|nr:hypothetical protein [Ruminococcus sp.]